MFGEIGAGKERLLVRRHDDGQGPAAGTGHGLADCHVDSINVRSFFPVHLDGDKVSIHQLRHLAVFEGLPFHDLTPVTRGVTDGEEDRFVLLFRFFEGRLGPGIPVHGIIGMLQKVGALLMNKLILFVIPPGLSSP